MNKTLASPNSIVWSYFESLRRLCNNISLCDNERHIKQDASMCIIMSVTGVEVFLNVYFRVLITNDKYKHAEQIILKDLKTKIGLDLKLKNWPQTVFGESIDYGSGIGQKFTTLKNLRNSLVHFSSSHESIKLPGVIIEGNADITAFSNLDESEAINSLVTAEAFICEIFRLNGMNQEKQQHALHSWTGKIPNI